MKVDMLDLVAALLAAVVGDFRDVGVAGVLGVCASVVRLSSVAPEDGRVDGGVREDCGDVEVDCTNVELSSGMAGLLRVGIASPD